MKKSKKWLSILLCAAFLIGLLPTVALAADAPTAPGLYYRQVNVSRENDQDVYELDEGNTAYQSSFTLDPSRTGYAQFYYYDGTNAPAAVAPGDVTASKGVNVEAIPGYTDFARITVTGFFNNGTIKRTETGESENSITVASELPEVGFYKASTASAENYLTQWTYDANNTENPDHLAKIYLVASGGTLSNVTLDQTGFVEITEESGAYAITPKSGVTLGTNWVSVNYTFAKSGETGRPGRASIQFNVPGSNPGGGGPGDPQPGPFTPGIHINDRGLPLDVVGAASPQNDGNYTFDKNVTSATVTFTDDCVKGLAVRVYNSDGLVLSNRLQQKSYTINDVSKFYEIEVIDYNAIFDNQYKADYDNSGSKTVKVGNVILDGNNTQTFITGQPIEFTASAEPYKVIVRPNDDRDVELPITGTTFRYTPDTDAGFELKVYWSADEYSYDQFRDTADLPIVVEYTKDSADATITVKAGESNIAAENTITYGSNTKVRVASDARLTFDWGQNAPKRICVEGEEKDPQGTSYTLDLTQDSKRFYRLEFRWTDDPEPDWYTVSWAGGNVTVDHGTVTAERVYLGDTIFTVYADEVDTSKKIYSIEAIRGVDGQEGLGEYGLGYGDTDLFIGNEVKGVSIDFKFKPDYGYQLSNIYATEETNSLLNDFTAAEATSTFHFAVLPGSNVHFKVKFTETANIIENSSSTVQSATISNGQNATDSGNLKMTVADLNPNVVSSELKAQAGESALYLDMNLYQVVNKVVEDGDWENQLEDLNDTITVTLNVPAPASGSTYFVIREHGEGASATYDRIEVTFVPDANDPTTGTITFQTDKFSNYALAQEAATPSVPTDPSDSSDSSDSSTPSNSTSTTTNPDGSTTTTVTDKTTGTVTETTKAKPVTDAAGNTTQTTTQTVTNKDGSTVETITDTVKRADGSRVETVTETKTNVNGVTTSTETVKATDTTGTTAEKVTKTDADDKSATTVSASLSTQAVTASAGSGKPVTLPVEVTVTATKTTETAPVVSVEVSAEAHAKVEIPVENATPGTVAVLVQADGTEKIVKTSVPGENGVVLTLDGSVTVKIVDNAKTFDDVRTSDWHSDAVDFVTARGIFNGNGDGTFTPGTSMTRGMLAMVLYNLEDNPDTALDGGFEDVANGAWYADAVGWAADRGIVTGYPDGTFGAEKFITREQLATMLWSYAGRPDTTGDVSRFADAGRISPYADTAMRWAVENGVLQGNGSGLNPTGSATRAETAQMLMNFLRSQNQ